MKQVLIPALRQNLEDTEKSFRLRAAKQLSLRPEDIRGLKVVRQSLDARKKNDLFYSVHCLVTVEEGVAKRLLSNPKLHAETVTAQKPEPLVHGNEPRRGAIVVAGFGPGGIFAGWLLAKEGYRPIIVERGKDMERRTADVEQYWVSGYPDPDSNPLFGEGGAGAFSDGKLTSRSKDSRGDLVLELLHKAGAPEEILRLSKPHVGTDKLREVVQNLRKEILAMGGEVRFETCFTGVTMENGTLRSITLRHKGQEETLPCDALVLAIGQGARDTYTYLYDHGFAMAPKPFAVGVRAEHPQSMVNVSQYGNFATHPRLGAAEYRLTARSGNRGVYTFCMCPGGYVVGSSAKAGEMVVNGMSYFARDGVNANAAVVVQVSPEDFGTGALDGMYFQQKLEQDAWKLGGGNGLAPACRVGDYLRGQKTTVFDGVQPTFRPGVVGTKLADCLPDFVAAGIQEGLQVFGRQLKGYDREDAVLTAVESRTSAPLRILRDEEGQSVSHKNVYPVGEGAGYAGGIVSAAIDGLRAAERIISRFRAE